MKKLKWVFFICGLSASSALAVENNNNLPLKIASTVVSTAAAFFRTMGNAIIPSEPINEEPIDEIKEEVVIEETKDEAEEQITIEPISREGNRVFIHGIPFEDGRFTEEVLLSGEGNDCALRGIYGTNNVNREEIIGNLIHQLEANTNLSREIQRLIAAEIFSLFLEMESEEAINTFLDSLLPDSDNAKKLKTFILNLLKNYKEDPSKQNRDQLYRFLQSPLLLKNYLQKILLNRIGNSPTDPYPQLEIQAGDQNDGGATGILAAIAAMRGVSLRIYYRDAQGCITLAATYILPQELRQVSEGGATVHLLHTTADRREPHARNHFNLLKPVNNFLTSRENLFTSASSYIAGFFEATLPIKDPITGKLKNTPLHFFSLPDRKFSRWAQKLGLNIQHHTPTLDDIENMDDPLNYPFAQLDDNDAHFGPVISEGFDFPNFEEADPTILVKEWQALLNQQKKLLNQIAHWEVSLFLEIYPKIKNNPMMAKLIRDNKEDRQFLFKYLAFLLRMKPTQKNLQFILLICDQYLRTAYLYYRNISNIEEFLPGAFNASAKKNTKINRLQEKRKQEMQDLDIYQSQAKEVGKHDIVLMRYFLGQLIHFCRLYGYEPIIPDYLSELKILSDEELKNTLDTLFAQKETKIQKNSEIKEKAESKKGAQKRSKKKKAYKKLPWGLSQRPSSPVPTLPQVSCEGAKATQPVSTGAIEEEECSQAGEEETPEESSNIIIQEIQEVPTHIDSMIVLTEELVGESDVLEEELYEWGRESFQHFCQEMREKKQRRESGAHTRSLQSSVHKSLADVIVLTPEERAAFHEYLNEHADVSLIGHFRNLLEARHRSLTQVELGQLPGRVAPHLRDFLLSRQHLDGSPVFTQEAVVRFVQEFLENDARFAHFFHPSEGKRGKLPKNWLEHRRAPWITLGLMPATVENRSTSLAIGNYQESLVVRFIQEAEASSNK